MNSILVKNKPEKTSTEDFIKAWDNSAFVLEALWKTLDQFIRDNNSVKKEDFETPNHYAKLAYQAGMTKAYQAVIDMLPPSAKPN